MQEPEGKATYAAHALAQFVTELLAAAGLPKDRAAIAAGAFLEADLLGYTTHGLNRVPANLEWLTSGDTRTDGEPEVLVDRPALFHWDAHRLPGPWVVTCAIHEAMQRVRSHGVVTALLRDCQHIACLAAYLIEPVQAGLVIQIVASSPDDRCVAPFGGRDAVFSPNPLAIGAPTGGDPILIDVTLSVVAEGRVARAAELGEPLPSPCLLTPAGETSADALAYWRTPKGTILPIGGLDHGHKGSALTLWSELTTLAMSNRGRADSKAYSEANTVWIQVIDPDAFGSRAGFEREASAIAAQCRASRPRPGVDAVRIPGTRAWHLRRQQLQEGVSLHPLIMPKLEPWAARLGVSMPRRLSD